MLTSTTPCTTRVSLDATSLRSCPVSVRSRSRSNAQLQDSASSSTPVQDRLLLTISDNKQLHELLQHYQLRSETARRKLDQSALNHANALFHASILVASLATFALGYLLLTAPKTNQADQADREAFKELDSLLLEESAEEQQLLEAFDQEVEEVYMMPLVIDCDPVKKSSCDYVNWSDCSHAVKVDSLDEGQFNDQSLMAVERQLDLGSVLTYDDVDWDKFPYDARARIFYLITNESMTAADLQVFEAELEKSAEALLNLKVVCFEDVQWQDYSFGNKAQIHQSICNNALTVAGLKAFQKDVRIEPEPQLHQSTEAEELESRYDVTIEDVNWDSLPLSMRLKVFYLVKQEKLTFAELLQFEHETSFAQEFVEDEKTEQLVQWELLAMEKVRQLYSDNESLAPDDCPLQSAQDCTFSNRDQCDLTGSFERDDLALQKKKPNYDDINWDSEVFYSTANIRLELYEKDMEL